VLRAAVGAAIAALGGHATMPAIAAEPVASGAAGSGTSGREYTASLRVSLPGLPVPARPGLLGSNLPWVYGGEGLMDDAAKARAAMWTRVKQIAPTVLRYPGGELADRYRWRDGIGPLAERPTLPAQGGHPPLKIVLGTLELLEVCEALGAEPLLMVNMHLASDDETAKEAADWVRWVNGTPRTSRLTGKPLPKVVHWELGNEPYLKNSREGDGANPMFLRPEAYARRVNKVMAAMKSADASLKLGLPFATDTLSLRPWRPGGEPATVVGEQLGYADKLLRGLEHPEDVAFLALHYYMPLISASPETLARNPKLLPDDDALYWGAATGAETIAQHLDLVTDFWKGHPHTARAKAPTLWITEYNAYFTNGRVDGREMKQNAYAASQAGALFVADLLRVMGEHPQVEAATHWSLTGNWIFGAIPGLDQWSQTNPAEAAVRPTFQALRLAHAWQAPGGRMMGTTVEAAGLPGAGRRVGFAAQQSSTRPLTSSASVTDGRVAVWLVNRDRHRTAVVQLDGAGLPEDATGRFEWVEPPAGGPLALADTPQAAVVRTLDMAAGTRRVRLPPAAFGLLLLERSPKR